MAEKKSPTLKELLARPSGENKSPAEILDTFKRCSRKGVSIRLESFEDVYALDEFDFSGMDLRRLKNYMEHGAEVCERKGRPRDSVSAYKGLFGYFCDRIPKRYDPRNP